LIGPIFTAIARFTASSDALTLLTRLVRENARDYYRSYILAFAFMGAAAVATGASAWIIKDVINRIFVARESGMIAVIVGTVLVIYSVKGFAAYGADIILNRIGNNIVARNQKRIYRHLLTQGVDYFQQTNLGTLSTRLTHNAQAARSVLDLVVTSFGRDVTSFISLMAVMILQDPVLSIVALLIMPPAVYGVSRLVKRVRKLVRSEFQSLSQIVTIVQETTLGIRIVKAFGLEASLTLKMDSAIENVERRARKIANINARTGPMMETLGGIAIAAVIAYGGFAVVHLGKDPGSFFSFITALLLAYEPAKRLARFQVQLQTGLTGVRMLYELLDTKPRLVDSPDARPLAVERGTIVFDGVDFRYGRRPALASLSLTIEGGTVAALVGPSGAGKTTMFALIERFYDPTQGRIMVDGQDIRDVTMASLRDHIALVTQDTVLFEGTVRENILFGQPEAGDEELVAACKAANAHEFIVELPQGYDTQLGEGGGRLSGGQRQRIAIARAMLRDAPILLLDEATSALDTVSEIKVQEALTRLMQGRTTIVIAHRLSTVRNADRIFVMNKGAVVQQGTHAELLAEGGLYGLLYESQFAEKAPAA
jgi:ATP-binding cassette, subfamily B, bacterial MsbA